MPEARREKPIIFSPPMIPGLLDGSKTQTRRIITPQPLAGLRESIFVPSGLEDGHGRPVKWRYNVGDRLWVRETTLDVETHVYTGPVYLASENGLNILEGGLGPVDDDYVDVDAAQIKLRSPIFMPRAHSRITLEVTAVSAQPVQAITEADAIAEGAPAEFLDFLMDAADFVRGKPVPESTHRNGFRALWNQIYGAGSFEAEPWVWVWAITFVRVEA